MTPAFAGEICNIVGPFEDGMLHLRQRIERFWTAYVTSGRSYVTSDGPYVTYLDADVTLAGPYTGRTCEPKAPNDRP